MLHTQDDFSCPVFVLSRDMHVPRVCEDCDVFSVARMSLGTVEDQYHDGYISHDMYEAYMYVWAFLSPHGGRAEWKATPTVPAVRRIARKLFRVRCIPPPAKLEDE